MIFRSDLMRFFLLFLLFYCKSAFAYSELYLKFHMGLGMNGDFFVGGTLENKGDQDVHQGYIVVTPLSSDCYPKSPQLWPFGKIAANSKFEFKVPIAGKLEGYKFDMVYAMDSFGNKITVIDETEPILNSKQTDYIAKCQLKRQSKVS
ncbi:hypothetical protein AEA42_18685 [Shewanella sp. Sh95]|nr:hypothetical protein AEA42_18685 [Shewanella sp. Sh95]